MYQATAEICRQTRGLEINRSITRALACRLSHVAVAQPLTCRSKACTVRPRHLNMHMAIMYCMTLTVSGGSRQMKLDFGCITQLLTLSQSQA